MDEDASSWAGSRFRLLALVLAVPLVGGLLARASPSESWFASIIGPAALLAAVWGITLITLIAVGGVAAANSREMLFALFRPGLYLTAISLVVLVVLHGGIALAVSLRFFRSAGLIFAVSAGAILGVTAIIGGVFLVVRKAQTNVIGAVVSPNESPQLWRHVRDTAARMGALEPEHIVVGLDPTFFVTEADVRCLSGEQSGRTLYCSLPLMRILERRQFTSILGHELGHFKGDDTRFSEKFYPIYRGTGSALEGMMSGESNASQLALLPAIAVLGYFMETFARAERRLSRTRELTADVEGAAVSDRRTTAEALVKVYAYAPLWGSFQERVHQSLRARSLFLNLSETYAEEVAGSAPAELLDGISESHLEHPTDSHPPLHVRLEALEVSLSDVTSAGLASRVSDPAIALIEEPEVVEKKLSVAYQELMAGFFGINLHRVPADTSESDRTSWSAKKRRERLKASRRRRG